MVRKLRCWNCGCKQPMPVLVEINCRFCGAVCLYVPSNMRGGKMKI